MAAEAERWQEDPREFPTLVVEVTQEDITEGLRGDCGLCPIALAMRRAGAINPQAFCDSLYWTDGEGQRWTAHATRTVDDFIVAFDTGFPVKPTRFIAYARKRVTAENYPYVTP